MKKNNIFLTLIAFIFFTGCANYNVPKYAEGEPVEDFQYPQDKEIVKSFYLLGDGGYSPPGGISEGLLAFKTFLDSVKQRGNHTIFLGDNIYPDGMEVEGHPDREASEYRVDAQLDAVENYDGELIFIPGNHDWYNKGVLGVKRQKEYIEEQLEKEDIWIPEPGCALESIEISDEIQLIIADSEWYLTNWDKNPLINNDCPEIKTREAFFQEVDSELKKNQNKTVIFAIHNPLFTNGIHGGYYNLDKHIYPSQKKIPVPILGSLVTLVRTSGGISIADKQNEKYKSLVDRLIPIATRWGNVIFVSGHDHSLQYVENSGIKQVISGSGSKASYAGLGNDGFFAYPGQGFAVLDLFEDGSTWVSYYGSVEQKPKLLYQKEVLPKPEPFNTDTLPKHFPPIIQTSIYETLNTQKGDIFKSIWGDRYRELYGVEIKAKTVELDTLMGGLEVIRRGGGHQTRSLRLQDSLGRDYNMRALEKSAVQFLQTVAFKDVPIESKFENTLAEDVVEDFYTSAHPYAFMAIPTLSKAAGIYHTNPQLFYVPKQEALGPYNNGHGDELYMIVERPEENWTGYESFGSPDHDIESTSGVFERLRRDEKYNLDEAAYIKARLFDMLVGDWDRHEDQWRWAEFEDDEGNHIFRPIPRDRDQVFSNFDGAFFNTLRGLTGFANQFAVYGEDIDDIAWFNSAAVGLDRSLIQNEGREEWLEQARFLQEKITDEVIEDAFNNLPEETRGEITDRLEKNLKARRDNIVDIAERYYDYFAEIAIVSATDKDDHIDIERMPQGRTRVTIYRIKDGEKADLVSERIYDSKFTEEIWIYGLDDEDIFEAYGEGDDEIYTRLIGGHDNDIYRINQGKKIRVYDHKSLPNTVERNNGGKVHFTDDYEVNTFDKDRRIFSGSAILPSIGYNPDDGFLIGINASYTINGFRRNPFTAQHRFRGGYYFATNSFDLNYQGEFANVWGNYNLMVGAHFTSPNYSRNFFGWGNETPNPEDELGKNFNRVRVSRIGGEVGFVRESDYGSYFKYAASFEGVQVEGTEDRILTEEYAPESDFYDRKYFAGLEGTYRYESYDNFLNPTNGMKFELVAGAKVNTGNTNRLFGYLDPYLGFFKALTSNKKWVLNPRVQAEINFGDDYEFYQAATLGGNTGLRGFRDERFTGKSAFVSGTDLRYSLPQFRTRFIPFQVGLFAGYDVGRVWLEGDYSDKWHDSYGGGFWITGAEAVSGKFNFFTGDEGLRFTFGFALKF